MGQFDDARLALAIARSAAAQGALLVNHCPVTGLVHRDGRVVGVQYQAEGIDTPGQIEAQCVVNATGVWVDELRRMDDSAAGRSTQTMVMPSQGVHLVVDRDFLPGNHAIACPAHTGWAGTVCRSLVGQAGAWHDRHAAQ